MKKILVYMLIVIVAAQSVNSLALDTSKFKSEYFDSSHQTDGFSHIGSFETFKDKPQIWFISYRTKFVHDLEVSDQTDIRYLTTLYPEIESTDFKLKYETNSIIEKIELPEKTYTLYSSIGNANTTTDISFMNAGIGIQVKNEKIIVDNLITSVNYDLSANKTFINSNIMLLNGYFKGNNATIALYLKTIRVKETIHEVDQSKINNSTNWKDDKISKSVKNYNIITSLAPLPITSIFKDSDLISKGQFYIDCMNKNIQSKYRSV